VKQVLLDKKKHENIFSINTKPMRFRFQKGQQIITKKFQQLS